MSTRLLLIGLLLSAMARTYGQTTYYISASGNDANDGRSTATPFQTINKLNTLTYLPGDQVLFRRGDTFRGSLVVQQSGTSANLIRVDAYGTGEKPVIAGSVPVTGWTNVGGSVWQATCSACGTNVTGVYQNGQSLPLGRYPNENTVNRGYLTVQSHSGKTSLTSQQALPSNFVGGEAVYRPTLWILNRAPITAQSGNTLTLNNASASYDITDGWGFFVQNHPNTLDYNGEWSYTASNKTIRLFSRQDPNNQLITATVQPQGIRLLNNRYVSVQNLRINQQLNAGFYAANVSNVTVANNDIEDSGEDGMLIHGSGANVTIQNNTIRRVYNNGTEVQSYTALTYQNNTLSQIALRPGRGKSSDGQYRAIDILSTTNNLFEGNRLDSIGYTGISFATLTFGLTLRRNIISNFLLTKGDGGGIYTFNGNEQSMGNIKILSNIIYGATGSNEGAIVGPTFSGANGIYLDYCTTGVEVSDNTVFSCKGIGLFVIGSYNNTIQRNTVFDNGESQLVMASGVKCPPRSNTTQSNVFVSRQPTTPTARYESNQNDLNLYGDINSNYYIRPFDNALLLNAAFLDNGVGANNPIGLADWRRLFGRDANSKTAPFGYQGFTLNSLTGANRIENSNFNGNALNWYTQSYYNNFKTEYSSTQLDNGSIRLFFSPASNYRASYGFMFGNAGNIVQGRSYLLRFDAVASANGKTVQAFLRQRYAPAQDLAIRVGSVINTTRQRYEIAFTATQNDSDAILLFSVLEDGQSLWLDNITLQEADVARQNPADYVKLAYNDRTTDTLINLDGNYRGIDNQFYARQIMLAPFTSAVLLRDTATTVDLALALQPGKAISRVNEVIPYTIRVRNQDITNTSQSASAQWTFRLPPNVQFVSGANITNSNGVLTAQTPPITKGSEVVYPFQLRLTQPGTYTMGAELTSGSLLDTDSEPSSGYTDGEDDAAQAIVRTVEPGAGFASPNPDQRILPRATPSEPQPNPTLADLSLSLVGSRFSGSVNQIISFTAIVTNRGGRDASGVAVQAVLPSGLQFVDGSGWNPNGSTLTGTFGYVPAGTTQRLTFRVRTTATGLQTLRSQVSQSTVGDPDSTVGNSFTNGEDDQATAEIRVF